MGKCLFCDEDYPYVPEPYTTCEAETCVKCPEHEQALAEAAFWDRAGDSTDWSKILDTE